MKPLMLNLEKETVGYFKIKSVGFFFFFSLLGIEMYTEDYFGVPGLQGLSSG